MQLAAEVLHEVRQPLLGVKAYAQMLRDDGQAKPPAALMLAQIDRMEQIIARLHAAGHRQGGAADAHQPRPPRPRGAEALPAQRRPGAAAARGRRRRPGRGPGQRPARRAAVREPARQRPRRDERAGAGEAGRHPRGARPVVLCRRLGPGHSRRSCARRCSALRHLEGPGQRPGAGGLPPHRPGAQRPDRPRPGEHPARPAAPGDGVPGALPRRGSARRRRAQAAPGGGRRGDHPRGLPRVDGPRVRGGRGRTAEEAIGRLQPELVRPHRHRQEPARPVGAGRRAGGAQARPGLAGHPHDRLPVAGHRAAGDRPRGGRLPPQAVRRHSRGARQDPRRTGFAASDPRPGHQQAGGRLRGQPGGRAADLRGAGAARPRAAGAARAGRRRRTGAGRGGGELGLRGRRTAQGDRAGQDRRPRRALHRPRREPHHGQHPRVLARWGRRVPAEALVRRESPEPASSRAPSNSRHDLAPRPRLAHRLARCPLWHRLLVRAPASRLGRRRASRRGRKRRRRRRRSRSTTATAARAAQASSPPRGSTARAGSPSTGPRSSSRSRAR